MSGEKDNQNIKYDIEGMAIYSLPEGEGYLVASSQGNSTYAFFERKAPNKYLGSISIISGDAIDGSEETDGLDVVNFAIGDRYPKGLLVVQDGSNKDNGIAAAQNYKIISWESVASKFTPVLN